jgi:NAD(P)-dependent dehydrogenase (short-subunit alcohol dehydrogenase family)
MGQERDVTGRIAVVTGAGSGIGRAVSAALLAEGYRVVLAGRRAERLDEVVAEHDPSGEATLAVPTDVTQPEQVNALFDAAVERWGRVDLLVNNAGGWGAAEPIEEIDPQTWQHLVDVNVSGMFYCTQAAFRVMKAQDPRGGRIINNGSVSAYAPRPRSAPYTTSKHAVTGLTKSAALDGREFDIAVGQIDIGNAETDMTSAMADGVPQADGRIAPEPVMDVDNVARGVVYMASLPLDANVLTMTVMATKMPYVGRG